MQELKTTDISDVPVLDTQEWEVAFEQLLVYLTYRHLTDSLDDGRFIARVQFAVQSYCMVKWISAIHFRKYGDIDLQTVAEIARIYSAEIEYSTDNIDALLNIFEQ